MNTPSKKHPNPITLHGPLGAVHKCPICGYYETSRKTVRYDGTRANGRIRTHISACARAAVAV